MSVISILIVEDDFRIANIHQEFLESIDGIQVVGQVLRAQEAWEIIESHPIDLVLVDVYMPDQLGIDLIKELKEKHEYLDFIVITAARETKLLERSLKAGIFYYLVKPVKLEKLKEVIEEYRRQKDLFERNDVVSQAMIDSLYSGSSASQSAEQYLPTGINSLTLAKVIEITRSLVEGATAEEIGQQLGSSRTTARRYLEYLVSTGEMKAELEYGIVGRPERRYFYL